MNKEWVIEKKVYKKCFNKYFLNSIKLLIVLLPILFVFSLFFILVGILDDVAAFDYGIPCLIFFIVFLFMIGIYYLTLYIKFIKQAKDTTYEFIFEDDRVIRYYINHSGEYQLKNYKLYNFENYYFINDYMNKKNILIPKKEIEDFPELSNNIQKESSKQYVSSKSQKIAFVLILIIIFAIIVLITSKTTKEYKGAHMLEYAQNIEMVQECYPKDSVQDYNYINSNFYYYNETYLFMPERNPEICIISLQYNENDYKEVLDKLTISNEYYYKTDSYEFYLHGNLELFPKRFSMIVLNQKKNTIIFLGFYDQANQYQKMIEEDFLKFISNVYGKYYDFN